MDPLDFEAVRDWQTGTAAVEKKAWQTTWFRLAVTLLMVLLVAVSFSGGADRIGEQYTETGFTRALITFASARAINGVISVAQGTEVAVQPGGIGAVLTPGEILDPINDLVEQFSQVMLFSAAVLGTQKLLIEMSGWIWFSLILAAAVVFWLLTLWRPRLFAPRMRRIALAASGILLLLRFLVPVAAIANEAVFDLFLAPRYELANQRLEEATRELGSDDKAIDPAGQHEETDSTLIKALQGFYDSVRTKTDVSAKLAELKTAANQTAEEIIELIALFMIQTLLLPVLFAWLGYAIAKRLAHYAMEAPPTRDSDSVR